jgi:predicted dehydrogenase
MTGDGPAVTVAPSEPGDYRGYYVAMRDAIRLGAPVPVTPPQALDVMRILELAVDSAAAGRELRVSSITDGDGPSSDQTISGPDTSVR